MKPILLISLFLISSHIEAQTTSGAVDTTRPVSISRSEEVDAPLLDISRPSISNIRRDGKSFTNQESRELLIRSERIERSGGDGGDDVGNGGDELRQAFLAMAQKMLEESRDSKIQQSLQSTLSIYKVIVVNNLSIVSGRDVIPVRATVAENIIFLDSKAWDPEGGLLSEQHDPRYEVLRLMNLAAGSPLQDEDLVVAWNKLHRKSGKIWCPFYPTSTGFSRNKKEFVLRGLNSEATENALMGVCQSHNLVDCRVAKVITRGNGLYEMTVTGFEISISGKSKSQQKEEKCEAARLCETIYEWAPRGQVSPGDYSSLANEVEKSCR